MESEDEIEDLDPLDLYSLSDFLILETLSDDEVSIKTAFNDHAEEGRESEAKDRIETLSDNEISRKVAFNDHGSNLIDGLKKLRKESNRLADLGLKVGTSCGEEVIYIHGCILASHSTYVAAFHRNMNLGAIIDLKKWSKDIVYCLIEWMYKGVLKIKTTDCYELLELSDYLCLDRLSEECIKFNRCNLNFENCCEMYMLSLQYHNEKLKKDTRDYFRANICQLLKGSYLTRLPRDHLLSILADDNLVIVDEKSFPLDYRESEMRLFNLIKGYIENNEVYDLWPSILENVLRLGFINESDLEQLVKSAPEGWLQKCEHKDTCLELLKKVQNLKCSQMDLSLNNCHWTRHRDMSKVIKYGDSKSFEFSYFTSDVPPIIFDDVTTLLKDIQGENQSTVLYVSGLKFYSQQVGDGIYLIRGMEVTYNIGKSFLYGKIEPDDNIIEVKLQCGERFVYIESECWNYANYFNLMTNLGNRCYYGFGYWDMNFKPKPGSYLVGIKGKIGTTRGRPYVVELCFTWGALVSIA